MFKITNIKKIAQSFLDEIENIDWGQDDQDADLLDSTDLLDNEVPETYGDQGIVNEDNYEEYEPATTDTDPLSDDLDIEKDRTEYQKEILGIPEETEEIEYSNSRQLIYDGIDNTEVISFDYTTRFGQFAGTRTVEPHYTFVANTTGNEVLVTFDRDYNDIRSFIVGNIHPFGVRYNKVKFLPKNKIMRGIA